MARVVFLTLFGAVLAACNQSGGGGGIGASPPDADPSAVAPLGESVSEPTDGFENEVSTDG